MLIELVARKFLTKVANGAPIATRATGNESQAVANVEGARAELARAGRRFMLGNSAAITGVAPVQALPTTAAQWAIWNADPSQSMWFEEIGMYLTSGTPGVGGLLLACLFQTPAQSGSSTAGASIASMSSGGRASKAIVKSAVTITTPASPTWYPIASDPSPNVTAFASSTFLEHRNLQGGLVVPPGWGLGLAVVSPAGTSPLFAPFGQWAEYDSDLE